MKSVIIGIVFTFGLLFTASSGMFKGQAFAYQEERYNYDYQDQYEKDSFYKTDKESNQFSDLIGSSYILEILNEVDHEQLKKIENKLFEGIDKDRLLNNALNLLKGLDFEELNEQLLQNSEDYAGDFVLILVLFILLVIIGAGFGLG